MKILRTPPERFADLPDFPYAPSMVDVGDGLQMAVIDEGPRDAAPILLLHGEPSWSFLYRHIMRPLLDAGRRVVAPDLIGFGRSDKLDDRNDYTYQRHLDWLRAALFDRLDLKGVRMFCQDWGGLLGLRLLAEHPDRFAKVIAGNTILPTGDQPAPEAFHKWLAFSQHYPKFTAGGVLQQGTVKTLPPEVIAAYDAPFPDASYLEGARIFPALVPITPDDPASAPNRAAWKVLRTLEVPFICAFSDQDPITAVGGPLFQKLIAGAQGQPHVTVTGAGHFLQEDAAPQLAALMLEHFEG